MNGVYSVDRFKQVGQIFARIILMQPPIEAHQLLGSPLTLSVPSVGEYDFP